MTDQLLGIPMWVWGIIAMVVVGIVVAAVSRAIARVRRSSSGSLRRRLTPGAFRVFLREESPGARADGSDGRPF